MLEATKKWMSSTSLSYRKKSGQYFTPDEIKLKIFQLLPKFDKPRVLEPAVGTGEFIPFIYDYFGKNCSIDTYDIDVDILKLIKDANTNHKSFLELDAKPIYDFVITNPPYGIEFDDCISPKFDEVIGGRVNIYSLFIKQGIDFLKQDGYLAYVVPSSMNNGKYFEQLRSYIIKTCEIENIIIFNDHKFTD